MGQSRSIFSQKLTRRRFVGLAAAGSVTLAAGLVSYPYSCRIGYKWARSVGKQLLKPTHVNELPDVSKFDRGVLMTNAVFVGALVGRKLSPDDTDELVTRLEFAVKHDAGWRSEYSWLARHVDATARKMGATDLVSASLETRDRIVSSTMAISPWSMRSITLGLVSSEERSRRRMIFSTVPHLIALYARSGVPFRARGYASWPGVPGDPREYTKPGPTISC